MKLKRFIFLFLIACCSTGITAFAQHNSTWEPITIQEQGSFAVGGKVITAPGEYTDPQNPAGQTLHGDHAYVFYQKPVNAKKYPLVMVHGINHFSKTWETTPDGREGFQNIFLRRGFSTYNVTYPRRGSAGRTTVGWTVDTTPDEQIWFNRSRLGIWPNYFEGVQYPQSEDALNQSFRQMTPNTGPFDLDNNSDAIAQLFDDLGGAIMVCHSHGGTHTWLTIPKTKNIKGVVAWEPGGFYSFPNDEPEPEIDFTIAKQFEGTEYIMVSPDVFSCFTKMPIVIIYGDNIPKKPSGNPEQDEWGVRLQLAKLWGKVVNRRGGDVTVIHLPEIGIYGNTHFPFSDLNNMEMADLMSKWLHEKGLDK